MSAFTDYVMKHYNAYPEILRYYYFREPFKPEINNYDFVFVSSDIAVPMKNCTAKQFMTGSETPDTYSWLEWDFAHIKCFNPISPEDIPTVGFVGRCPLFDEPSGQQGGSQKVLHRGFEPRYNALDVLQKSSKICTDFHIRFNPEGDSAGFWNDSMAKLHPDEIPLFKLNMRSNVYTLCARGNSNWSVRFYETLAYGRIPIYIESGGKVPFINLSDRELPFVYNTNIKNLESDVLTFHETHDLKRCQIECHKFYVSNFTQFAQIRAFDNLYNEMDTLYHDKR